MTKKNKYIELAFFLILNIFLSIPGVTAFYILPLISFGVLQDDRSIAILFLLPFAFFLKLIIFSFIYRRKNLNHIHKILNKFLTDKKFFLNIILLSIGLDVTTNTLLPDKYTFLIPIQCSDITREEIPLITIAAIIFLLSGLTGSYLIFWCLQKFKLLKSRLNPKKCLTGLKTVIRKKICFPVFCSLLTIIIVLATKPSYGIYHNIFSATITVLSITIVVEAFIAIISITLILIVNHVKIAKKKSVTLAIAKTCQGLETFFYLNGTLFLLILI